MLSELLAHLKIKEITGHQSIFDPIRKKWLILTPEELVRQSVIYYLSEIKGYSLSLMNAEKEITFNNMKKRYDVVVYNKHAQPVILVECKSPQVNISQPAVDQASVYNQTMQVRYIWITNGHQHFIYEIDYENNNIKIKQDIPSSVQ